MAEAPTTEKLVTIEEPLTNPLTQVKNEKKRYPQGRREERAMNVAEALAWSERVLQDAGVPEPRTDAEWLLSHVLRTQRTLLYMESERAMDAEARQNFEALVYERCKRIPLAYLLGTQPFCGLTLKVDERVMIPRPETEQLVELVVGYLQRVRGKPLLLADIGTGSGAIALALAHCFPEATVYGIDISEGALEVAQENAQRLGLSKRVVFLHGDLTEPLEGIFPTHTFDALVANLPYVPDGDWEQLEPEVRYYEPAVALKGGADGLEVMRRFLRRPLQRLLTSYGFMALEIGAGQAKMMQTLLWRQKWKRVIIHKDFNGIDRFIVTQR